MSYVPAGSHSVIAAINMPNAADAMDWYKKIFNAKENIRLTDSDGKVSHGEIDIHGTVIMIAEEHPGYNQSPQTLKGTSVIFVIYVPDADATIHKAVADGARLITPASDQFYGDRSGRIEDPYGYKWIVSTHINKVSAEEMQAMMDQML